MKKTSSFAAAAAAAFILAGCSTAVVEVPSLAGKTFEGSFSGESGRTQFISFSEDGRVYGYAGCNRFNGAYVQDGAKLSMDKFAMTRMMCTPRSNAAESAFIDALNKTVEFAASDEGIVLVGADGSRLAELAYKK